MIYLASDHAGFDLKAIIRQHLIDNNIEYVDSGSYHKGKVCDYPDIARYACEQMADGDIAILICGTGIGMSITANKIKGIRAACVSDVYTTKLSRLHNNANVLCIGARITGTLHALEIVDTFLNTKYEGGGLHDARIAKIEDGD